MIQMGYDNHRSFQYHPKCNYMACNHSRYHQGGNGIDTTTGMASTTGSCNGIKCSDRHVEDEQQLLQFVLVLEQ